MNNRSPEEICKAYLKKLSVAHAIPRIIECLVLGQFNYHPPILDLGCGEGVFARLFLGKGKIDVGLDIDPKVAGLAGKSGAYQKVVTAPGGKIPFEDAFFNTVVSNSVLEHIENLDPVFSEVYRVLKKNGRFIFIVPDKSLSEHFFYAKLLEKIKLECLANAYIKLKNKLFRYAHLENKKFWEEISHRGGFRIKKVVGLVSPETVRFIDLFSPFALPDYVLRRIFHRSFIFRPDFMANIIASYILPYCQSVEESEATGWCFELVKE